MQLRHKIFLTLSLLSTVPLLILLFGVVDRMQQEVMARTETTLHAALDKMAGELQVLLNGQQAVAQGLARVPSVQRFAEAVRRNDRAAYEQAAEELSTFFLNYQHAVSSIQALRFLDPSGKTLVKVKEGKPIEATHLDPATGRYYIADQSYKEFFHRSLQRDVAMSDFEMGQVEAGGDFCPAMVRYSVQVRDEVDHLGGLLWVNMWGSRVDDTVQAALGGYPGQVYIVELNEDPVRDGIYLYHPVTERRFANQTGKDFRFSQVLAASQWEAVRQGATYGSLVRDDGRIYFYRKFAPDPERPARWLLVIEASKQMLFGPINSMRQWIWTLLGALVVLSLAMAVWAAVRLARPVHHLAAIITRYADGEREVRYQGQRQDEVGAAGKAFNYLVESLDKANRERARAERAARQSERLAAVGQLAAGIGHEINNPLMNIMSLAQLIEASVASGDEQLRSDIKLLQKEGARCSRIVQGILNFARETAPSFRAFDMAALIDDTLSLMAHRFSAAGLSLETDIERPLSMEGDPNQLQQVLVNLLLNAVQASPQGSRVHLSAKAGADRIILEIRDSGPGIEEADLDRVFNPFFTTKEAGRGSGLGLSVSYGIIKHHEGSIVLENAADGGLRVRVELPVTIADPGEARTARVREVSHVG